MRVSGSAPASQAAPGGLSTLPGFAPAFWREQPPLRAASARPEKASGGLRCMERRSHEQKPTAVGGDRAQTKLEAPGRSLQVGSVVHRPAEHTRSGESCLSVPALMSAHLELRSANPALSGETFRWRSAHGREDAMTIRGPSTRRRSALRSIASRFRSELDLETWASAIRVSAASLLGLIRRDS